MGFLYQLTEFLFLHVPFTSQIEVLNDKHSSCTFWSAVNDTREVGNAEDF